MNLPNYVDYKIKITTLGIDFFQVENYKEDIESIPVFKGMIPCLPDLKTAKTALLQRASLEIVKFHLMGQLNSGDHIRIFQSIKKLYLNLEIQLLYPDSLAAIEKFFTNPYILQNKKKDEIKNLHEKINEYLDEERYDLAEQLVDKITLIRNEFMI